METIEEIKEMVCGWLAPDAEACLDRLVQIYGEDVTRLERAGAGGVDAEASALFERLMERVEAENGEAL